MATPALATVHNTQNWTTKKCLVTKRRYLQMFVKLQRKRIPNRETKANSLLAISLL